MRQPLFFAVFAVALGCADSTLIDTPQPSELTCSPACGSWQTCKEGQCLVAAGHCAATASCTVAGQICDPSSHVCIDDSRCDACKAWETCQSGGTCELTSGRCRVDPDCTNGTCNLSTHRCVAATCAPACAEWQTCGGTTCGLTAGRCLDNTGCPTAKPICEIGTHLCAAPGLATPAQAPSRALIVTSTAMRRPFDDLARLHTLTGVPTRVVTITEICAQRTCNTDPRTDTAHAIKEYLAAQQGLEYVVLGGDIEIVPSRQIHDQFKNTIAGADFDENFYTDYYYADLSQWDGNGDGVYAEDGVDNPAYRTPELGVTRIPASTVAEADLYVTKVLAHLTDYNLQRVSTALLLSNVATSFTVLSVEIPIDGAIYYAMDGRTESIVAPFTTSKLYAVPPPGTEQITLPREIEEIQRSHNIIVHNGHGWVHGLTSEINGDRELTGDMAYGLTNTQLPFILSCACDAGTFSANDSAGEDLMNAPDGGAIGYLGNSATGLGLAGGAQLVDEFLRHVFTHANALVGDAIRAAHRNVPSSDAMPIPVPWLGNVDVPVVDQDSYEWTQKSAVFLGDGLIPVWSDPLLAVAPGVTVTRGMIGQFSRLSFHLSKSVAGSVRAVIGTDVYDVPMTGTDGSLTLSTAPNGLTWGFSSATTLAATGDVTF